MPEVTSAQAFRRAESLPDRPAAGETHLWRVAISGPLPSTALLSVEEQRQHLQFQFCEDRDRYRVSHVALREILGGYLSLDPLALAFTSGPWGKPVLASHQPGLEFNLSHSGRYALIAIQSGAPVGVDLEHHKEDLDPGELADRIFSPAELKAFHALPAAEQLAHFYHAWTTKEAVLKALGTGLTIEPACVSIPSAEGITPAEVQSHGQSVRLSVRPVEVAAGYTAALASPQPLAHLTCFEYGR